MPSHTHPAQGRRLHGLSSSDSQASTIAEGKRCAIELMGLRDVVVAHPHTPPPSAHPRGDVASDRRNYQMGVTSRSCGRHHRLALRY